MTDTTASQSPPEQPASNDAVREAEKIAEERLFFKRQWAQEQERGEKLQNENESLRRQLDALSTPFPASADEGLVSYEELAIMHGQQVTVTFKEKADAFALFNELKRRANSPVAEGEAGR